MHPEQKTKFQINKCTISINIWRDEKFRFFFYRKNHSGRKFSLAAVFSSSSYPNYILNIFGNFKQRKHTKMDKHWREIFKFFVLF